MSKILTNNTQLSNATISTNVLLSITQEILSELGFKDLSKDMLEAEHIDELSKQQLIAAIQAYTKNSDYQHATDLINILDIEIKKIGKEYTLAKARQIQYQIAAQNEKKLSHNRSYPYQFLNWFYKETKQFFGSDNTSLTKYYEEIAKSREIQLKKLREYRNNLAIESVAPSSDNQEKISSQFPANFPLSNLNGRNGVKFTGSAQTVSGAGDVNGDGLQDLLTGTPSNNDLTGEIYLVFGSKGTWPSEVNLANINSSIGVKFYGEHAGDNCGVSLSTAGDVNSDGLDDFLIAASTANNNKGAVYLVYGQVEAWPNSFFLANLNGTNGVKFMSSQISSSGYSVSNAGDVNGDGVPDFIIGGPLANNDAGISYLVFGKKEGWTSPFNLDSLDGTNGVVFTGENTNDRSGASVSGAGDINGDGFDDLLIAAPFASNGALSGITYLIFGHNGTWVNSFSLANLNGVNGVKFYGEHPNTLCGFSVSKLGDINKDGFDDLIISAPYAYGYGGISYVIFGHNGFWSNSIYLLLYLNGNNGFKIMGENPDDESGYSVSSADINEDGRPDALIGSPISNGVSGNTYVVFGKEGSWSTPLFLNNLNGINGMKFLGEHVNDGNGLSVSWVGDANGDKIADFISGSPYFEGAIGRSYLVFGDKGYMNIPKSFSIQQGGVFIFNNSYLYANFTDASAEKVQFIISNIQNGYFELLDQPGQVINNFTQHEVNANKVLLMHDGSCVAPSYEIGSSGGRIAFTSPIKANINLISVNPEITTNSIVINQGQSLILSSLMLNTYDPEDVPSKVHYTITEIRYGQFALLTAPNLQITQFTQEQINQEQVLFIPDNSELVPSYTLLVQNSCGLVSNPSTATVYLRRVPVLGNNQLTLTQGQTITLSLNNLNATNVNNQSLNALLQFIVSEAQHGHFEALNNFGTVINTFFQKNISDGNIQFIHDGRIDAPSYSVAVSDGTLTSLPHSALINFSLENQLSNDSGNALKSIITWLLSAGTILGFSTFILRCCITRKNEEYLSLRSKPLLRDVVMPIFNAISEEINCTGVLSYMSDESKKNYITAIESIVNELNSLLPQGAKKVEEIVSNNNGKPSAERDQLLKGIASHAKFILNDELYNCCSCGSRCSRCASCSRLFFAEISPQQLQKNARKIARGVKNKLYNDTEDNFPDLYSDGESTSVRENEHAALILSGGASLNRQLLPLNAGITSSSNDARVNIGAVEKNQGDYKTPLLSPSPLTPSWSAQRRTTADNGSATIAMLPPQTSDIPHADFKQRK